MKNMLFIILISTLTGCYFDDDNPTKVVPCIYNCDTSKLEVVWQVPLHQDTGEYGSFSPFLYNNDVLFSLIFLTDKETLKMRDGKTGELKWEWNAPFGYGYSDFSNGVFLKGNQLLYCNESEVYSINMDNGGTTWGYDIQGGCGSPRISLIDNCVYHVHHPCGVADNAAYIVRTNVNDGLVWDTVFTQYIKNGYSPIMEPPSFWLNSQGDSILFILNRMVNFSISSDTSNKVDLTAYNLTQKKLEYVIENFDPKGNVNFRPPLVWNDRIFIQGHTAIYCFDAASGQKLWATLYKGAGEHTTTGNLLIVNNKLIAITNMSNLYAFDPWSGTEIWKTPNAGSNGVSMVENDGIIYYGCIGDGRLHAVEAETGKHIWREKSPNEKTGFPGASFLTGVAINPSLGYLYTSDNYFAMCIKLPKR